MGLTDIKLRTTTHAPYQTKGSRLTWAELDRNLYEIADAITPPAVAASNFAPYDNAATYEGNTPYFVSYSGNIYKFIGVTNSTGNLPTNTTYWELTSTGTFMTPVAMTVTQTRKVISIGTTGALPVGALINITDAYQGQANIFLRARTPKTLEKSGYGTLRGTVAGTAGFLWNAEIECVMLYRISASLDIVDRFYDPAKENDIQSTNVAGFDWSLATSTGNIIQNGLVTGSAGIFEDNQVTNCIPAITMTTGTTFSRNRVEFMYGGNINMTTSGALMQYNLISGRVNINIDQSGCSIETCTFKSDNSHYTTVNFSAANCYLERSHFENSNTINFNNSGCAIQNSHLNRVTVNFSAGSCLIESTTIAAALNQHATITFSNANSQIKFSQITGNESKTISFTTSVNNPGAGYIVNSEIKAANVTIKGSIALDRATINTNLDFSNLDSVLTQFATFGGTYTIDGSTLYCSDNNFYLDITGLTSITQTQYTGILGKIDLYSNNATESINDMTAPLEQNPLGVKFGFATSNFALQTVTFEAEPNPGSPSPGKLYLEAAGDATITNYYLTTSSLLDSDFIHLQCIGGTSYRQIGGSIL
jgi:hypothetical protein